MESAFLEWLEEQLDSHPRVVLGVGDDAAVLASQPAPTVICVDTIVDQVDFLLNECESPLVGRKALAINLSDLAAMGASPVAALSSLTVPPNFGLKRCQLVYEGLLSLAREYSVALVGGDFTVADGPLSLTVTVLGDPPEGGVWRRSGATPGDQLYVSGELGGSLLGKHLTFRPRLAESQWLRDTIQVTSCIDISDGLLLSAHLLADASCAAIELNTDTLPISDDAHIMAKQTGRTPLDHALHDGEDFELLFSVPPTAAPIPSTVPELGFRFTQIGVFTEGRGVQAKSPEGETKSLPRRGYRHDP